MSKEEKRYAVIDTETTKREQKPFQTAIAITNERGQIIDLSAMWVPDFLDDDEPFYPPNLATLGVPTEEDIVKAVVEEVNEKVDATFAYNSGFDKRVLEEHCKVNFKKPLKDLWTAAAVYICDEDYIEWAEDNNYLTEKGNIRTGAEYVLRYILNNNDFKTKHGATEDVIAESWILNHLIEDGVDVEKIQNHSAPWRIVKKRREKMKSNNSLTQRKRRKNGARKK